MNDKYIKEELTFLTMTLTKKIKKGTIIKIEGIPFELVYPTLTRGNKENFSLINPQVFMKTATKLGGKHSALTKKRISQGLIEHWEKRKNER